VQWRWCESSSPAIVEGALAPLRRSSYTVRGAIPPPQHRCACHYASHGATWPTMYVHTGADGPLHESRGVGRPEPVAGEEQPLGLRSTDTRRATRDRC
jgi:hypothetical protein